MNSSELVVSGGSFGDLANNLDGFLWTDVREFQKAVQSGYGSDVATFTGGRALQLQSIEHTLLATVQKTEDFKAFNSLTKSSATATVDEYMQQTTVGGFPGDSFNSEVGQINESEADYKRRILEIKYLMTMRSVSVVQTATKTAVNTITNQTVSAIKQLMSSVEWGIFYGDSSCSAEEFDGADAILTAQASADHFIDLRGKGITAAAVEFVSAAQLVASYGNFGRLDTSYMSNLVAADLDQKLDPALRVNISSEAKSGVKVGAPVSQIVTRFGNITPKHDLFIREGDMPFASRSAAMAALVTAADVDPATAVVVTVTPTAGSQFLTEHGGTYYWAAEGGNKKGRSALVKSTGHTIAAGDGASVAITETGGGNHTYFMVYRSRRNGTNTNSDFREMIRVAANGGGTTTYVDLNQNIPGTSKIFLFTESEDAITVRRLLPMTKFALYPSNTPVIPWAHLIFLALRIGKPNQHVIIKNVLPSAAAWQPF